MLFTFETDVFYFLYKSRLNDLTAQLNIEYFKSSHNTIRSGFSYASHFFNPGYQIFKTSQSDEGSSANMGNQQFNSSEINAYFENELEFKRIKANFGIHHLSYFSKEFFNTSIQPRISGRYLINAKNSIKFSFSNMSQPIHLLTNNGSGMPNDLWVPATKRFLPEKANQYAIGYAKYMRFNIEFSIDIYYKSLKNVIEFKNAIDFMNTAINWQDKVLSGKGNSYGCEFFLQKKTGKLSGWAGYTLAWSNREITGINNGNVYPYKYDRRHDFKAVIIYQLTKSIDFSANWIYITGSPITMPTAIYNAAGLVDNYDFNNWIFGGGTSTNNTPIDYIPIRNNVRTENYHRLDINFEFKKPKKHGTRVISVSIYNVFNRKNAFIYYFEETAKGRKLKKICVLPFIPSISYTYNFN